MRCFLNKKEPMDRISTANLFILVPKQRPTDMKEDQVHLGRAAARMVTRIGPRPCNFVAIFSADLHTSNDDHGCCDLNRNNTNTSIDSTDVLNDTNSSI
jgi:hypothetical protein